MLMTEIRDYIQLRGRINLQELARHFYVKESAMQQMMKFWVNKGVITVISLQDCKNNACSDCFQCTDNNSMKQIYIFNTN